MQKKQNWFFIIMMVASVMINSGLSAAELEIRNAWIREAPPVARNLAGYVEFSNPSEQQIKIVSAYSDVFAAVEFHISKFENGMMRMQKLDNVILAPGDKISFEPGGQHLMLIGPKHRIAAGLKVSVVLELSDGSKQTMDMNVIK